MQNHLEAIRTATALSYEHFDSVPCNGFADVLTGFVERTHDYVLIDTLPVWHRVRHGEQEAPRGTIYYDFRHIFIRPRQSPLISTAVLAHEIAHIYTQQIEDTIKDMCVAEGPWVYRHSTYSMAMEDVTDAVACAIMRDYGFDTAAKTNYFIYEAPKKGYSAEELAATPATDWFDSGRLDMLATSCYHDFAADLSRYIGG